MSKKQLMGADYEPAIKTHQVPSLGRVTRFNSGGRTAHVLSDLETRVFKHYKWDCKEFDTQEQVALDQETTVQIAKDMNVRHPTAAGNVLVTMTTDLVVYFHGPHGECRVARSVKYSKDLDLAGASTDRMRTKVMGTLEKLEIERRYWEIHGVPWALITEKDVSKERGKNIELLLNTKLDDDKPEGYWHDAIRAVCERLTDSDGATLGELQRELAEKMLLPANEFTDCLRAMCRDRQLVFDMDRLFELSRPCSDFQFAVDEAA